MLDKHNRVFIHIESLLIVARDVMPNRQKVIIMAKNSSKKNDSKKESKVVQPKNPKPDYTPAVKVPKKKEVEKPSIYYRTESTFSVKEEGAGCTWNEGSRQLCLDAAQDFLEEYTATARLPIFIFAKRAALAETWKQLNDEEYNFFGGLITRGSHMKRQRFWKFVTYIGNAKIPPDLQIRSGVREGFNGKARSDVIEYLCTQIKGWATSQIDSGSAPSQLIRISCTVSYWKPVAEYFINYETAPHNYDPMTMKGYKTIKEWSTHP